MSLANESIRSKTIRTATNATQQAKLAAHNIIALSRKEPLQAYEPADNQIMFTLGKDMGVLSWKGILLKGKFVTKLKSMWEHGYMRGM